MVGALSDALLAVCPDFLLRYIHIIMLLLCVVIIYVIPFQIFNALYPIFISIGAGFGIPAGSGHRAVCLQPVAGNKFHADELVYLYRVRADGRRRFSISVKKRSRSRL